MKIKARSHRDRYVCGAWLTILAAGLVALAPGVWAAPAAPAGGNSDVARIDAKTPLVSLQLSQHDQRRTNDLRATLPPEHKIEVECTTIAPGGSAVRYVCRLTVLNAAGKPDGQEINYADWYQHASRIATYKDGVLDGVERQFDVPGAFVTSETPWVKGKIQGIRRSFHPTGKLANETPYENGLVQGISRTYDVEGQVIRVTPFVKGAREGDAIDYWPGKASAVERSVPYHKGKVDGVAKAFYLNGTPKWERPFKDNRQHGVEKQYAADGTLEKTIYWRNGNQVPAEDYARKGGK